MPLTLAIDPGTWQGWAIFEDAILMACGVAAPPSLVVARVIVERQAIYPRSPVAPESILKLALRAGEAGGWYGLAQGVKPEYVLPQEWKGSASKPISHKRIWHRMGPQEQAITGAAAKEICDAHPRCPAHRSAAHSRECTDIQGDMLDAIGIGLWAIGRKA
jgi:hypothetical protein